MMPEVTKEQNSTFSNAQSQKIKIVASLFLDIPFCFVLRLRNKQYLVKDAQMIFIILSIFSDNQ